MKKIFFLFAILAANLAISCSLKEGGNKQEAGTNTATSTSPAQTSAKTDPLHWIESFESGSKGAYANGVVTLETGVWQLDDALIAGSPADAKNGTRSLRIKGTGSAMMNFSVPGNVKQITITHGVYGSDAPSTWQLWYSANDGSTWTQAGNDISTSSATLSTETFPLNAEGNIRLKLCKVSGGRLNIDDITMTGTMTAGDAAGTHTAAMTNAGPADHDDNMGMGNPSGATNSISNRNNYLMVKKQYTLSYNNSKGIANWVSWHLSRSCFGDADRCNCFTPDASLPEGFQKVTTADYSGAGFDRGHLCPSGDRTTSAEDNAATFLMTNMTPQAPNMNEVTWEAFESYCRHLADDGNELYIIAGWYGQGGNGHNGGTTNAIANGKVYVPAHFWKVALILPDGTNDVSRVTTATRVIAIDMPNTQSVKAHNWGYYRTSVDAIEKATGYDLLNNISVGVQAVIEEQTDNGPTR